MLSVEFRSVEWRLILTVAFSLSFATGSTLNVCSRYLQDELQCCSQSDEDVLGMRLNSTVRYNVTLGSELQSLQANYGSLIAALSSKFYVTVLI